MRVPLSRGAVSFLGPFSAVLTARLRTHELVSADTSASGNGDASGLIRGCGGALLSGESATARGVRIAWCDEQRTGWLAGRSYASRPWLRCCCHAMGGKAAPALVVAGTRLSGLWMACGRPAGLPVCPLVVRCALSGGGVHKGLAYPG